MAIEINSSVENAARAEVGEITAEEYARRQAAAARFVTARIADPAERARLLAMLGLPQSARILAA